MNNNIYEFIPWLLQITNIVILRNSSIGHIDGSSIPLENTNANKNKL